jgi:hypothetical protein
MTETEEIKEMLKAIMDHLGIGKNPVIVRKSAKETAERILNLEAEKIKRGHVGAISRKR